MRGANGERGGADRSWRQAGSTGDAALPCRPQRGHQLGSLTLQSQASPGDGHMRGSGNVPGAACAEWNTHRVSALPRRSRTRETENPAGLALCGPGRLDAQCPG